MSGALWALAAGVGFGVFQTANRLAVRGMDVYLSTFLQLLVSLLVLGLVALFSVDLGLLRTVTLEPALYFSLAAFVHFFLGWTFLNASQKRIGAARTTPLISTTPLFATVSAAVTLAEIPGPAVLSGVALVVIGVYALAREEVPTGVGGEVHPAAEGEPLDPSAAGRHTDHTGMSRLPWRASLPGLGAALCWATSPIFIRHGLRGLPSPLLGLTVGLIPSVIAYGAIVALRQRGPGVRATREALTLKVFAGALVGLSTWARWVALALAPVAVVLTVAQISVPLVILLAPLVAGRGLEHVTPRVWAGASLIVAASVLLILTG